MNELKIKIGKLLYSVLGHTRECSCDKHPGDFGYFCTCGKTYIKAVDETFVEIEKEYVSKDKIRELMLVIKEEIDSRPQYANVGKEGCYRRLSELL